MDLANNNVGGDRVGLHNDYSRCATLKNYRRQIWDAWTCVARPWSALHVRMRVLVSGSAVGASGDVHTQVFSGRKRVPRLGRELKSDVWGNLRALSLELLFVNGAIECWHLMAALCSCRSLWNTSKTAKALQPLQRARNATLLGCVFNHGPRLGSRDLNHRGLEGAEIIADNRLALALSFVGVYLLRGSKLDPCRTLSRISGLDLDCM